MTRKSNNGQEAKTMRTEVAKAYEPIFTTEKSKIMIKSGRVAGKTYHATQKICQKFLTEDGDIMVFRAFSQDNLQSIYSEIVQMLVEWGYAEVISTTKRPASIYHQSNGNTIHFLGVGGPDESRTKGYHPYKPYSLIVGEELQQIPKQENLDQAMATFVRDLNDENGQILFLFNPQRISSHWINAYYRARQHSKQWLTLHTSYKDIAQYLNEHSLAEIETERKTNPTNYRYLYLGETDGLFGAVYANFDPERHVVYEETIRAMIKKVGIHTFIVGVDPASTRDKTAAIPAVILNNGQVFVLNYFYHNPETNGVLPNPQLIKHIRFWLEETMDYWGIRSNFPVTMTFDSASPNLRHVAEVEMPHNVETHSFSKKDVIENAQIVQNAFSRNVLYVLDNGGIFNYVTERKERGNDPLIRQLQEVVWNEAGDAFEKRIDNDATDALTYAVAYYFLNVEALYFPRPKNFYIPVKEKLEKEEERMRRRGANS